jgi:glycosyltransferase involved in cell wall biosynthesis
MVPTANAERFVTETLQSLAAQDYPNLEIMIFDDASTDATWAICRSFADADARFHVVRHASPLGWPGIVNALLESVDGEYAFFAPHDDLFERSYVRRMVESLELRSDAVLAFSQTLRFDDMGPRELRTGALSARPGGRIRRGLRYILMTLEKDRAIPFRGVARISALRQVGGLRITDTVVFSADVRWLFRLNLIGPFVLVPETLCRKRAYPPGVIHGIVALLPPGSDTDLSGPLNQLLTRGRSARLMILEALMYVSEIRAAQLRASERAALLAGVPVRIGLVLLPRPMRPRARHLLARVCR